MSRDIIVISADPWEHYTWRRRHHVAWNLAKDNRVLFVEPPLTLLQPFTDIDLSWRHLLNLGKLKHQGRNLFSYSSWRKYPLSLPFSRRFDYEKMNREDVCRGIKKAAEKLDFKDPILWVYYHPYHYDYYGLFGEKLVVTDWYDMFVAPTGERLPEAEVRGIKAIEGRILSKADVIFAVSGDIEQYVSGNKGKVYLMPHGVDVDSFRDAAGSEQDIESGLKRPVLGFLGIMHNKIDFELLNYIMSRKPEWSLLLMGKEWLRNEEDIKYFRQLKNKKNVFFAGELKKEQIPGFLRKTDVCLLPFKRSEFNRASTGPLKAWQYFAAGKPVVAVDQGLEFDCAKYVYKAKDKEGFVSMIEKALNDDSVELAEERKNMAFANSWENRVRKMMQIIEGHL